MTHQPLISIFLCSYLSFVSASPNNFIGLPEIPAEREQLNVNTLEVVGNNNGEQTCPRAEDIDPCFCYNDGKGLHIECDHDLSNEDLIKVFQSDFPDKELYGFSLNSNHLMEQLENVFNDITFEFFQITSTTMTSIAPDAFEGSKQTVRNFDFEFDKLSSIPTDFTGYEQLYLIVLNDQAFTELPIFISETLMQITADYSENITGLPSDVVGQVPNLEVLKVTHCENLEELKAGTFIIPQDSELAIDLSYNNLKTIEAGTFQTASEPNSISFTINLALNQLTDIPEEVFAPIMDSISVLYYDKNPLDCDCDIAWLVENESYMQKLSISTACGNTTLVANLDPAYYTANC